MSRLRPWHVLVLGAVLFAILRFALPGLPRMLTADESDALLGALRLDAELSDARAPRPLDERLVAGFETTPYHPRLGVISLAKTEERAVLEAPVPRWLGALGIGVLPSSDDATHLERASTASALAVALALALLAWGERRRGAVHVLVLVGALAGMPGVIDAARSSGYGAAALFLTSAFLVVLARALERGGPAASLGVGACIGLLLGVHPMAFVLVPVVYVAWAIRHVGPSFAAPGSLPLPAVPLALLASPIVALVVLVALWPALWSETGLRLGSWLLDYGSQPSPPHEVLDVVYDQASGRSAQAFTALLQWVAWTPLPILGLWLLGLWRAVRAGPGEREGAWPPIVMLASLIVVGALAGGLFAARGSLLALAWVPTAITAAHGAVHLLEIAERRIASVRPRFLPAGEHVRAALFVALVTIVPILQAARGTTMGMARETGAELRFPLPLALAREAAEARPFGLTAAHPFPEHVRPGLEAARAGLSIHLRVGSLEGGAELVLLTTASGGEPPDELAPRLERELGRDVRGGLDISLWELSSPGRLDNRPSLPHN